MVMMIIILPLRHRSLHNKILCLLTRLNKTVRLLFMVIPYYTMVIQKLICFVFWFQIGSSVSTTTTRYIK